MKKSHVIGVLMAMLLAFGAIPAIAQAPPLPETFEALGLSVNYPEGWAAREGDSGLEIVNDESHFDLMDDDTDDTVPSGAFALLILDPATLAGLEIFPIDDIMGLMSGQMAQEGELTVGDLVEVSVGDVDAVRVPLEEVEEETEGYLLGFKPDDETVIIAVVAAHIGELDQFEDVAAAILETITYKPPEAGDADPATESTTTFAALGVAIDLPEGWVGSEEDGSIVLANSAETLEASQSSTVTGIESGQLAIYVLPPFDAEELGGMSLPDVMGLFIGGMVSDLEEASAGDVTEDTVGDLSGYSAVFVQPDANMEGEVVGIDTDESKYLIVLVIGYTGEYEDQRAQVWEILATLKLDE